MIFSDLTNVIPELRLRVASERDCDTDATVWQKDRSCGVIVRVIEVHFYRDHSPSWERFGTGKLCPESLREP